MAFTESTIFWRGERFTRLEQQQRTHFRFGNFQITGRNLNLTQLVDRAFGDGEW